MSAFEKLHPALQHHIVNTLGWRSLHPLQQAAIEPLLAGEHALLVAPTAGGKTEAAFFPVLSRMLVEDWRGLTVLYVCPLRALLNNLVVRLGHYCDLVGRRVELWHGDVGDAARRRITSDPPDCLLITPESLEVILVSRQREKERLFGKVRCAIVDEIHAFAGDDRGWHLLAVLERVQRFAGREIQRIGLSATVGEPEQLLEWLVASGTGGRRVIGPRGGGTDADVTLDYVGTIDNAATVVERLHRGEKRLVFCDSRGRVEQIAAQLRRSGVDTYVSHSSLSREARRQAESAFASGTDCVIVATSTLELGIDVGDLDRVIQIDAPRTVANFLQRLGRTGRRAGTQRNCLFLATSAPALLRAAALLELWQRGYVEPVEPPPSPFHILAQQVMALALQQGGIGTSGWWNWVRGVPGFAAMPKQSVEAVARFMLERDILWDDNGILWFGRHGEERFGRRHFMELFSAFTSDPMVTVRYGRTHLGEVDPATFILRREEVPVILLAGRSWVVNHIDWEDRVAYVQPAPEGGRSRWLGSSQPLHYALCQAVRRVLAGADVEGKLSRRAKAKLDEVREEYPWIEAGRTTVVGGESGATWWTFVGLCANAAIAEELRRRGLETKSDNFGIRVYNEKVRGTEAAIREVRRMDPRALLTLAERKRIDELKFSSCLPEQIAVGMLQERLTDHAAIKAVLGEPVRFVTAKRG